MKIALTGGIACGKSLVQQYLQAYGVPVIDADEVTHQLYDTDADLQACIREHFGDAVFNSNGSVNRKNLGDAAFGHPEALALLSSWIHPKVRQQIQVFFEVSVDTPDQMAVAVIPVLFESSQQENYDEVWVVNATPAQQLERLITHRGLTTDEARVRMESQIPIAEKIAQADRVIDNTGTSATLKAQIDHLLTQYRWKPTISAR